MPSSEDFQYYGARGIKVCDRWGSSFDNFLADMGRKPSPNSSIERKNNDLGYEPENCIWIPIERQALNKRTTIKIAYRGQVLPLVTVASMVGLNAKCLKHRILKLGWSVEQATSIAKYGGYGIGIQR